MSRGSKNVLYTIGYEGLDIEQFVSRLKQYNINSLMDVRELPLSRKKGFSKTLLQKRLEEEGLSYFHAKELGSPREIRRKLKEDKDYASFFEEFSKYLEQNQNTVKEISDYLLGKIYCLMCFEQSADQCHRSIVAENFVTLQNNRFQVVHI